MPKSRAALLAFLATALVSCRSIIGLDEVSFDGAAPGNRGAACSKGSECTSKVCTGGTCRLPTCSDGVRNQSESDTDCGGPCGECPTGLKCAGPADCATGICAGGTCTDPSCSDGAKNGSETEIDCGGDKCDPCGADAHCLKAGDCQSGVCSNGVCAAPACTDGVTNGGETDLDCGGSCPRCSDDAGCSTGKDCTSGVCSALGRCSAPTCTDGVVNGSEADVDCGLGCPQCDILKHCNAAFECASRICTPAAQQCSAFNCFDGITNGTDTDVDCGGLCPSCSVGKSCRLGVDCSSGVCDSNLRCSRPSCTDGVQNQDESDIDCGGPCSGCPDRYSCLVDKDCSIGLCRGHLCTFPTCDNGVMDGILEDQETGVDCGGPRCVPCSCRGSTSFCGEHSCCAHPSMPAGSFSNLGNYYSVSFFDLDKYEITVGRFREFVNAWDAGWRPAAGSGKHTRVNTGNGLSSTTGGYELGWDATWNAPLATTPGEWTNNLTCAATPTTTPTWTEVPGTNEHRPIDCITWYEAYAFCIWDSGFLPSDAEWVYASSGGEERMYPWLQQCPSCGNIDCTFANFDGGRSPAFVFAACPAPLSTINGPDTVAGLLDVGSMSPRGDGRFGHADLAGNVAEWVLDAHEAVARPCTDCVVTTGATRVILGGSVLDDATHVGTWARVEAAQESRSVTVGARCARE